MSAEFVDEFGNGFIELEIQTLNESIKSVSIVGTNEHGAVFDLSTANPFEIAAFFRMCAKAKADYQELTGYNLDA